MSLRLRKVHTNRPFLTSSTSRPSQPASLAFRKRPIEFFPCSTSSVKTSQKTLKLSNAPSAPSFQLPKPTRHCRKTISQVPSAGLSSIIQTCKLLFKQTVTFRPICIYSVVGFLDYLRSHPDLAASASNIRKPKLDYHSLFAILERGRVAKRRVLVGSSPLVCVPLCTATEKFQQSLF